MAQTEQNTRPGEGPARDASSRGPRLLVTAADTGGGLALIETTEVRGDGPPAHLHQREDEILYVLEGGVDVWKAGQWIAAPVGTAVFLPRLTEHSFAVTTETARLLVIMSPAGLERLFEDLGGQSLGSVSDAEFLVTMAARYGVEITGPSPQHAPTPERR